MYPCLFCQTMYQESSCSVRNCLLKFTLTFVCLLLYACTQVTNHSVTRYLRRLNWYKVLAAVCHIWFACEQTSQGNRRCLRAGNIWYDTTSLELSRRKSGHSYSGMWFGNQLRVGREGGREDIITSFLWWFSHLLKHFWVPSSTHRIAYTFDGQCCYMAILWFDRVLNFEFGRFRGLSNKIPKPLERDDLDSWLGMFVSVKIIFW